MKKLRLAALLLLAALFPGLLTGCHGSRGLPAFRVPESFDASRSYELTFWAKNDTNKNQTMIYEKAIRDFEALYPNIRVSLRLYTDYGRIYNDVITNIATGTTPNVCITYPDHIATYLTGVNVMAPLDDLAADSRYGLGGSEVRFDGPGGEEIVSGYLEECRFSGHLYALPFMRSTEALYVNRTFVEKLGYTLPETVTWDFIWEVSDAAARQDGDGTYLLNGQKVMIPFIYKSTDNMMIQMLRQKGAGYSTESGQILLFNDDTKSLLEEIALHTARGAFSTFKISSYPANFLNAGQCVFAVDSTAGATWMGSGAPLSDISPDRVVDFETAVLPIPQFDPQHPVMISQGPSVCVFNKEDPQEVLAAWLFTQYLLTNGVQIAYAETEGYVPVTEKARQDPAYLDYLSRSGEDDEHYAVKLQATRLLLDHTEDTFVTPVFNGSASLRDAAGQLIENTVKSVRRKETVDGAYYEKLFGSVTSLYRLDRQGLSAEGEKAELGPLPGTARGLLIGVIAVWALMGAYLLLEAYRRRKQDRA
jgi:multiple sugar transport system substrate-binding protein